MRGPGAGGQGPVLESLSKSFPDPRPPTPGPEADAPRRVGLLGGAFNPVHYGHLQIAEEVQKRLRLDRVLFIPSGDPPHKTGKEIAPAAHRLEMTRLAIMGRPHFELSDIEVRRPGRSYSIETVLELKRLHPKDRFFFIIGTDAFSEFATWREADRLLTLCDFVVVSRPGHPFSRLPSLPFFKTLDPAPLLRLDEGREERVAAPSGPDTLLYFLRLPPSAVSASEIRRKLASPKEEEREKTKNLLPEAARSYIIKNKLYGEEQA